MRNMNQTLVTNTAAIAVALALLGLQSAETRDRAPLDPPALRDAISGNWLVRGGGTWVEGNGILRQADSTVVDPKKYVVPALGTAGNQEIVAQIRVDSFPSTFSRAGVTLRSDA